MVKYNIEKYPMGSLKRQKTPGRYMDGALHENLKILAKSIVRDMTFLGILYSSTLEVGTGKSVLAQQIAEAYTEQVNIIHKDKLAEPITFTTKNIVFRPKDLMERAFQVPKYSCILLDEWEDAHYWSELGTTFRQFFRKCRQLNLFILCIIPNFFQLPMGYAISRSVFAVDVRFAGEFERGYFSFYNFNRKKDLYIRGKKTYNYGVCQPNFSGRFLDGYAVGEEAYREAKYKDMLEAEEDAETKQPTITQLKQEMFKTIAKHLPDIPTDKWSEIFGVSMRTIQYWRSRVHDNAIRALKKDTPINEDERAQLLLNKLKTKEGEAVETPQNEVQEEGRHNGRSKY